MEFGPPGPEVPVADAGVSTDVIGRYTGREVKGGCTECEGDNKGWKGAPRGKTVGVAEAQIGKIMLVVGEGSREGGGGKLRSVAAQDEENVQQKARRVFAGAAAKCGVPRDHLSQVPQDPKKFTY